MGWSIQKPEAAGTAERDAVLSSLTRPEGYFEKERT